MQYYLKGLKTFTGNEGGGYEAFIYLGTKKIAHAFNGANGGPDDFHFFDRADEKPFVDFAAAWYETSHAKPEWEALTKHYGGNVDPGAAHKIESWVADAVSQADEQKWLKRNSKTKTLFRLNGDDRFNWRTLKGPPGEKAIQWLRNKYGDQVETIYGESTIKERPGTLAIKPIQATIAPSSLNF